MKQFDKIMWTLLGLAALIGWCAIVAGYWEPTTQQLALWVMPLTAFVARARFLLIDKENE